MERGRLGRRRGFRTAMRARTPALPEKSALASVRISARALIVQDGRLLTIRMEAQSEGVFYVLPGGGQRHGEDLKQALVRECREELGIEIDVGKLAYVREFIADRHHVEAVPKDFHQVETVFHAQVKDASNLGSGSQSDALQRGVEWLPIERLGDVVLYPSQIVPLLQAGGWPIRDHYLGPVN
jgi:8-oxo-dGTP diphosphatase